MNAEQTEQLRIREEAIAVTVRELERIERRIEVLKEDMINAKAEKVSMDAKLRRLNADIADVMEGVQLLPFKDYQDDAEEADDPDHIDGTPALNALGKVLFAAMKQATAAGLAADVDTLSAFGYAEKVVETIKEGLAVTTIGELAEAMSRPDAKLKGFGKAKWEKLGNAVAKYMTEAKAPAGESQDNRVKKCGCGKTRPQGTTGDKCACGSTAFELADPIATGRTLFESAETITIRCDSGDEIYVNFVNTRGTFRSSFSFNDDGRTVGENVPHHQSHGFASQLEAVLHAATAAATELTALERDDDAANVREWAQNQEPAETVSTED